MIGPGSDETAHLVREALAYERRKMRKKKNVICNLWTRKAIQLSEKILCQDQEMKSVQTQNCMIWHLERFRKSKTMF